MSWKVVKNSADEIVAFGPNEDFYQPFVKTGETLSVQIQDPSTPVTPENN